MSKYVELACSLCTAQSQQQGCREAEHGFAAYAPQALLAAQEAHAVTECADWQQPLRMDNACVQIRLAGMVTLQQISWQSL